MFAIVGIMLGYLNSLVQYLLIIPFSTFDIPQVNFLDIYQASSQTYQEEHYTNVHTNSLKVVICPMEKDANILCIHDMMQNELSRMELSFLRKKEFELKYQDL